MSREIGFRYGEVLYDYFTGIELVDSRVRGEVRRDLDKLNLELETLKHKRLAAEEKRALAVEKLQKVTQHRSRVEEIKNVNPSQFSFFKGSFYVALSVLLILADVSILGQVIARFLDYDWRSPTLGMTFAQAVFTAPIQAFKEFPDLFSLTLAVLVMGLFLKVWRDSYISREGGESRLKKWEFWIATLFLFLSGVSIVVMAGARLTIDIGRTEGMLPRAVSAILGFSLPFVSAGFFIKGYDLVENRILLWCLSRRERRLQSLADQLSQTVDGIGAQIEITKKSRDQLASGDYLAEKIAAETSAFDQGYREGVERLLSTTTIFERFRPIVLREYLSSSTDSG